MSPGELVRGARQIAGLSQRRLAAVAGVSSGLVSGVESGRRRPSWIQLAQLLEACGQELALAAPVPALADEEKRYLRLSTSQRLYWALGGRGDPGRAASSPRWRELGRLCRGRTVSLSSPSAVAVWLPPDAPVELVVVEVHTSDRRAIPVRAEGLLAIPLAQPLPRSSIPVGVTRELDVHVPTPLALALDPLLSDLAPRLRAVNRELDRYPALDAARRRRPAHRVTDPVSEEWVIRQNRTFGPLGEVPDPLDRREWRAGGIVSFAQWLAQHGYDDVRVPSRTRAAATRARDAAADAAERARIDAEWDAMHEAQEREAQEREAQEAAASDDAA